MEHVQKFRRRNYFINKKFQSYFIIRFSLGIFLSTILLGTILFYVSKSGTTIVFKNLRLHMIPTNEYLFPSLTLGMIFSIFITSSLSLIFGLMYSHRIAGPMYRFENIFKKLVHGDFKQSAQLRLNDEWQSTSAQLEQALSAIRDKMNNLNDDFQGLKELLDESDAEISKRVSKLEQSIQKFKF